MPHTAVFVANEKCVPKGDRARGTTERYENIAESILFGATVVGDDDTITKIEILLVSRGKTRILLFGKQNRTLRDDAKNADNFPGAQIAFRILLLTLFF